MLSMACVTNRLLSPFGLDPHTLTDAEGDAARLLESEAAACELRVELARQRQVSDRYRSEAANVPRLQVRGPMG